jgi:hypothetical protein
MKPPKSFNAQPDRRMLGFKTVPQNRPGIIGLVRKHVRDHRLLVQSQFFTRELATLTWELKKQRIEAAPGSHDDRIMAMAVLMGAWYGGYGKWGDPTFTWERLEQAQRVEDAHPGRPAPPLPLPRSAEVLRERAALRGGLRDSRAMGTTTGIGVEP